ncbi:unnamed protein product [Darwinula stevensoni]|uniref:Uncharacterized protein n=1 Tax=Darwinula stevensoni TaxID=69355 RepID=A0A7R8XD67_9CRUS|nr:unnamed protein product [Darwinula stevensoni]CAG0894007.1 unnamed protein product [Darwinula stevensoni]
MAQGGGKKFASDTVTVNTYLYLLSNLTQDEKIHIMQDRDEFIRSCTYEGVDCRSYFLPYVNTTYGTCYSFNLILNNDSDPSSGSRRTVFTGPPYGLDLELYLNASEWPSSALSSRGGVRVVIHRPDSLPSPEESGFDARAGSATNVALRQVEVSRLPYPYEHDCYSAWEKCGYYPSNSGNISYDVQMCRRMCLQATMVGSCKCKVPYIQDYFTFSNGTLNASRVCDIQAYKSLGIHLFFDITPDRVPKVWDRVSSLAGILSPSSTPHGVVWGDALKSMDLTQIRQNGSGSISTEVVKLLIYFSSVTQETMEESPAVTSITLLSNLGGALSLYLGISLVMFLEIIEIIPMIALAYISKCFGIGHKPPEDPPPRKRVPRRRAEHPIASAWGMKPN